MNDRTYLVYVPIRFFHFQRWAGERGLMSRGIFDEGAAFHLLLSNIFGKRVLQPFRLFASDRRRTATLYAYSDVASSELQQRAANFATPDCVEVVRPPTIRTKAMPMAFSRGQRLGFDVHVRPVCRLSRDIRLPFGRGRRGEGNGASRVMTRGSEIDIYYRQIVDGAVDQDRSGLGDFRTGEALGLRQQIYLGWLNERLGSAAEIDKGSRLAAFRRVRSIRNRRVVEGPSATLHGVLKVTDPVDFGEVLRHGIGRHKAYGYGMLLLRPPGVDAKRK